MEATSIKRLKTQKDITSLLPLPDGIHALATVNHNNQIWKVNLETGEMMACFGEERKGKDDGKPDTATFNRPKSLAMKSDGSVIVADTYNHLIREISPCGRYVLLNPTLDKLEHALIILSTYLYIQLYSHHSRRQKY